MVNRECDVLTLIIHDELSNVSYFEPWACTAIRLFLRRTFVLKQIIQK